MGARLLLTAQDAAQLSRWQVAKEEEQGRRRGGATARYGRAGANSRDAQFFDQRLGGQEPVAEALALLSASRVCCVVARSRARAGFPGLISPAMPMKPCRLTSVWHMPHPEETGASAREAMWFLT